jgi:GNAT superfamily N-acetyltransferase
MAAQALFGRDRTEPVVRVAVTVTFLRMDSPPAAPAPALPPHVSVVPVPAPSVGFYRYLYDTVGAPHVWWLRRTMADAALAELLANPAIHISVLYGGGEPLGFFELDARPVPDINLSYFGLVPAAVGKGLGFAFLRAAVDKAWALGARAVTVNTCTADHPRALPAYQRAGFRPVRTARETWDVPVRLGLSIPDHLRV